MSTILTADIINKYSDVESLNKKQLIEIATTCSPTLLTRMLDIFRRALSCIHIPTTWIDNYFENRGITLISKYNDHFVSSNFYPKDMAEFAAKAELTRHPKSIVSKTNDLGRKIQDICTKGEQFKALGSSNAETALNFFRLCTEEQQQQILTSLGAVLSPKEVKQDDRSPVEILLSAINKDPIQAAKTITLKFLNSYLTKDDETTVEEAINALSHRIITLFTCVQSKYQEKAIPTNIIEFLNQVLPLFTQQPEVGQRTEHLNALKKLILNFILSNEIIDLLLEKGIQKLEKANKKKGIFDLSLDPSTLLTGFFGLAKTALFDWVPSQSSTLQSLGTKALDSYFNGPGNHQRKIKKALKVLIIQDEPSMFGNFFGTSKKKEIEKKINQDPAQKQKVKQAIDKLIDIVEQRKPLLPAENQATMDRFLGVIQLIQEDKTVSQEQIATLEKGAQTLIDFLETRKFEEEKKTGIRTIVAKVIDLFVPHTGALSDYFNLMENVETAQQIKAQVEKVIELRKEFPESDETLQATQETKEALKAFLQTLIEKHLSDYFDHLNPALQEILKSS